MLPWGEGYASRTTCIADRFYLGGASSLRGFKFKGVGPTDMRRPSQTASAGGASSTSAPSSDVPLAKQDALGGDLYSSMMASVS